MTAVEGHWGLRETPFEDWPNPLRYFESGSHQEAQARLHYLAQTRRRAAIVVGGSGLGKSLAGKVLARRQWRRGRPTALVNLRQTDDDWIRQVGSQWGLNLDLGARPAVVKQRLLDRLTAFRWEERGATVVLDDADLARFGARDAIRQLLEISTLLDGWLCVVATCDPGRVDRLTDLCELAELRIELEPWTLNETAAYLCTAVQDAGGSPQVFAPDARAHLHQLSGGVPRLINRLAAVCLAGGAGQQLSQITADCVEGARIELGLDAAAQGASV